MDAHTAGGGFDTSTLTHRRQEPNTSNRIRPEPHRRPPSEKALQRPIEPPVRLTGPLSGPDHPPRSAPSRTLIIPCRPPSSCKNLT